jgi:hypothetical protein
MWVRPGVRLLNGTYYFLAAGDPLNGKFDIT